MIVKSPDPSFSTVQVRASAVPMSNPTIIENRAIRFMIRPSYFSNVTRRVTAAPPASTFTT